MANDGLSSVCRRGIPCPTRRGGEKFDVEFSDERPQGWKGRKVMRRWGKRDERG